MLEESDGDVVTDPDLRGRLQRPAMLWLARKECNLNYLRSVLCQSVIATVFIGFATPCFSENLDLKVLHLLNTPRADSAENIVIRSEEEWNSHWNRGQKERTSPPIIIDFSQFTLIIATLGRKGNSTLGIFFWVFVISYG